MVPGVTDTDENLAGIASLVENMPALVEVDLLPYNRPPARNIAMPGWSSSRITMKRSR